MAFRETVLKKIRLDGLAKKVRNSLGREGVNIDKESMRALFAVSDYSQEKIRDMELFVRDVPGEKPDVIVLDNGLDRYRTSIEDVALRKSPTIKEMISIRNAKKILSDGDVLVSRKEKTLDFLQASLIQGLDLSWKDEDILSLAKHGAIHLEAKDEEGVEEDLSVFAEILGLVNIPVIWRNPAWWLYGKKFDGIFRYIIAFSPADYRLLKIEGAFVEGNREEADTIVASLLGEKKVEISGRAVFDDLVTILLDLGEVEPFYMEEKVGS